jgi:hypothetical protein
MLTVTFGLRAVLKLINANEVPYPSLSMYPVYKYLVGIAVGDCAFKAMVATHNKMVAIKAVDFFMLLVLEL